VAQASAVTGCTSTGANRASQAGSPGTGITAVARTPVQQV